MGKNTTISVNASPDGVITAAVIKRVTIACFLYFVKNERFKIPSLDKSHDNNGNSKISPIIKQSIKKLSIYESSETLFSIYELKLYPARNRKVRGKTIR